ncbi:aldo/keto reductase [Methanospirillum sp. J.3.6.1-F.2.7.3]|uniref:Aldo/keto reductase n=1 Tax=Methanospirillum purgamenti TaxID=2834276 RepID=A0A8E7AW82_9EURY|nr:MULTISPECIES: aldo/keto reductase [Methanospirillum]MDX8551340.1 aldo/keto reductase [Methanospirillum hungatei]QVV87895.1 aldo/keto reductase [Methanospirillum sp. J.3.6.1-F.2.7.3]
MLYRKFPRCSHEISILGFGAMRLPLAGEQQDAGNIDEEQAIAMIRTAVDGGVNYIDTAYPYHNGMSEVVVGKALGEGYRDRVFLATKLHSWLITSREDMDRYLDEQLARMNTDHIDFYLLHGLGSETWENLTRLGVLEFLDSAKADGRIRYPAFSFHDQVSVFREIVDAYEWVFAQIQYNYMDEQNQAGTEGLKYAAEQGLGIVVMEPLRGGLLSGDVPIIHQHILDAPVMRTPSDWGLRWVWNHPEVTVVLSGMSSLEQVKENLASATQGLPNSLSPEELAVVEKMRETFASRLKIPCTGCRYCMPCQNNVDIPECFNYYNQAYTYEAEEKAKGVYLWALSGAFSGGIPGYASCCIQCGECEEKCPQGLPIREYLQEVADCFGK